MARHVSERTASESACAEGSGGPFGRFAPQFVRGSSMFGGCALDMERAAVVCVVYVCFASRWSLFRVGYLEVAGPTSHAIDTSTVCPRHVPAVPGA